MCTFRILFVDDRIVSSMKESDSLGSVEKCSDSFVSKDPNFQNEQIEIEREVITDPNLIVIASDSVMANTKQTA